jgi:hypothetical protein
MADSSTLTADPGNPTRACGHQADVELVPQRHVVPLLERHLRHCRLVEDRVRMLEFFPRNGVAAELGVLAGDFSEKILEIAQPRKLYLIDQYWSRDWAWREISRFDEAHHRDFVERRFLPHTQSGRVVIESGNSWEVLARFPRDTFDFVYIDAAHDYESVRRDLEAARETAKQGGLIALNDYISYDHVAKMEYGVVEAVNAFCNQYDYEVVFFALHTSMFNDVVLAKIRS